ncbi:AraC family transcriptional regulator [Emticicia oligotrophica]|uniref:AraC family transcriptional regulator n=1 Tax=Emticicia oligotrophica TaxID=312279 RepID=UPI00273A7A58|nr:AraC family transcriptional regulator [Emticicia oligotrophica]
MNQLKKGDYFGSHYQKSVFDEIIVTDTEYTHPKVDWHYHQNPYFTFLLQGQLFEANKKESYHLEQGSLLFHNWQDAHYNIKPPVYTRGFHVELNENWFKKFDIPPVNFEGSMNLKNPLAKSLMGKIFIESRANDQIISLGLDSLLIELFSTIGDTQKISSKKPDWVSKLQELLWEENSDYSLQYLSATLGIHPIHLSREFSRYFGTNISQYIRLVKVNKAFVLMASHKFSLTEICYQCGFYDQSHFISSFKRVFQTTPSKLLSKMC